MRSQPRNCIATSALLVLLSFFCVASAWAAQAVGTVVNLNGPLLARKADGTVKVLAQKSEVHNGDTLVTEKNVYARIRFIDQSEVTLRPNTTFKIENFSFDETRPESDDARFNLVKGGLRAVTGALGKRSQERVEYHTPAATIGIRGTRFNAAYLPSGDQPGGPGNAGPQGLFRNQQPAGERGAPPAGARRVSAGLYVQVIDGRIRLSNAGGSLDFTAGQAGFTPAPNVPPAMLPSEPEVDFSLPSGFAVGNEPSGSGGSGGSGQEGGDGAAAECEVR